MTNHEPKREVRSDGGLAPETGPLTPEQGHPERLGRRIILRVGNRALTGPEPKNGFSVINRHRPEQMPMATLDGPEPVENDVRPLNPRRIEEIEQGTSERREER